MKDYYETLGVKLDASQEEISARWAELMRKYLTNPPQDPETDQKLQEINEAYQILNNEASRFDYDLDRAFENPLSKGLEKATPLKPKAISSQPEVIFLPPGDTIPEEPETASPEVKRFRFGRIFLPAALLIVLLIVGLSIYQRHPVERPTMTTPPQDKSEALFQPPLPSIPSTGKSSASKEQPRPKMDLKSEKSTEAEKRVPEEEDRLVFGKPERTNSETGLPVRKDALPTKPKDPAKVQVEPKQGSSVSSKPTPEPTKQPPGNTRPGSTGSPSSPGSTGSPGSDDTKDPFERVQFFGY
jgi:curved DNA-binding protein CbpA